MLIGKYLRANIKYWYVVDFYGYRRIWTWGEEGEKLFAFPRNVYLDFSLVLGVERKLLGLKFFVTKVALSWVAGAAA